jgi:hypothetical protein
MFFRLTLDSFTDMAFNIKVGSLTATEPLPFAEAFDYAQRRVEQRIFLPGWQLWEPFSALLIKEATSLSSL